ncbi:hydroxysteroid dehydrogenase-like protein 2 [Daphnia carinata]|uniref:hydroxysteroid dehydrogenase-like protein 2 n=1 Tax=Daphnia carinata TaxID=120202 RepID=UPI00257C88E1|nr:hydroxysteroid dehydrogenase-like protein 2 [Daphnia carinata]
MLNTGKLAGRTLFITGASRGIGKAIALKAARDGANVVIAAKTAKPHPTLPGTIYTAAEEVRAAGGRCLSCVVDVRNETQIQDAVDVAVKTFGGIDIVVNNASAIFLTGTAETSVKNFDLMHDIIVRGTFLVTKFCLPYLKTGKNPHILNIAPPLMHLPAERFSGHVAYTMAKYGMSIFVTGMAEEFRSEGIAVNALWPKSGTAIKTAATELRAKRMSQEDIALLLKLKLRIPDVTADAAYAILTRDSRSYTQHFCIDEDVLRDEGITDFEQYSASIPNWVPRV